MTARWLKVAGLTAGIGLAVWLVAVALVIRGMARAGELLEDAGAEWDD